MEQGDKLNTSEEPDQDTKETNGNINSMNPSRVASNVVRVIAL